MYFMHTLLPLACSCAKSNSARLPQWRCIERRFCRKNADTPEHNGTAAVPLCSGVSAFFLQNLRR